MPGVWLPKAFQFNLHCSVVADGKGHIVQPVHPRWKVWICVVCTSLHSLVNDRNFLINNSYIDVFVGLKQQKSMKRTNQTANSPLHGSQDCFTPVENLMAIGWPQVLFSLPASKSSWGRRAPVPSQHAEKQTRKEAEKKNSGPFCTYASLASEKPSQALSDVIPGHSHSNPAFSLKSSPFKRAFSDGCW